MMKRINLMKSVFGLLYRNQAIRLKLNSKNSFKLMVTGLIVTIRTLQVTFCVYSMVRTLTLRTYPFYKPVNHRPRQTIIVVMLMTTTGACLSFIQHKKKFLFSFTLRQNKRLTIVMDSDSLTNNNLWHVARMKLCWKKMTIKAKFRHQTGQMDMKLISIVSGQ